MKNTLISLSALSLSFWLGACDGSSSSDEAPASSPVAPVTDDAVGNDPQPSTGEATAPGASAATNTSGSVNAADPEPQGEEATTAVGEEGTSVPTAGVFEEVIQLNSTYLEYSRMQYDCGNIAVPIGNDFVESYLVGPKRFETLAATIPAKDQALVKIRTEEGGIACTYRAIFSVNKAFTEVTFLSSQALDAKGLTGCGQAKTSIDAGFGTQPVAFDYDKKFIRWVALHIPEAMQSAPVCPSGNLRAVFAGAIL